MNDFKLGLHGECLKILENRLDALRQELESLKESAASDTKSSMGDKYETAREMINLEKSKLSERMQITQNSVYTLGKIEPTKDSHKVELGALVKTNVGLYFLAAPIGQVEFENTTVFVISLSSPLAQQIMGLTTGDKFQLTGREQKILSID